MISIDKIVLDFLAENGLTVLAAYAILHGLAQESPWRWDEKVVKIIGSALDIFKLRDKPPRVEPPM